IGCQQEHNRHSALTGANVPYEVSLPNHSLLHERAGVCPKKGQMRRQTISDVSSVGSRVEPYDRRRQNHGDLQRSTSQEVGM
ncbi:MAG: hypothetical protein M1415_08490, partial [Firmicutes bacterium]|nr:hypothetical protein [Bacillota bacterium]